MKTMYNLRYVAVLLILRVLIKWCTSIVISICTISSLGRTRGFVANTLISQNNMSSLPAFVDQLCFYIVCAEGAIFIISDATLRLSCRFAETLLTVLLIF